MIIVEGPDNVGKTTLVEQLIELDPRITLIKRKRFKIGRSETIGSSYLDALLAAQELDESGYAIIDRLLASECIYGDLFRGGCRMTDAEHFAIRSVLQAYRAIVIHCDAPDEAIIQSWSAREQLYDDPLIIARAYRDRMSTIFPDLLVIRYDWTRPDAESIRRQIVAVHRNRFEEMQGLNKLREI